MLTRMVVLVSLLLMSLPLFAQATTAPAAESDTAAVVGELKGTNVYVRSGPSTTGAYQCAKISKPASVTVIEGKGEWLKILPTPGCFSVVSKKFVQVAADGKSGKITGDNVWVRAGGELCTGTRPEDFYTYQCQLNSGQDVEVIGSVGEVYKIVPPQNAAFWISAQYVELGGKTAPRAGAKVIAGGVSVETVREENGAETTVVVAKAPEAAVVPMIDSTARADWRAAEKELQAQYQKPADQRDLNGLIARYQSIKTENDDYLSRAVASRVKYLNEQLKQLDEAKQWQEIAQRTRQDQDKLRAALADITVKTNTGAMPTVYAADGVLTPSGLFPGTEVTPKRYVIRDPDTSRITAYVQCTSGEVRLDPFVNQHVGVTGATQYDRGLGLYIVEAKEVKVLKADAKMPLPPQPVVLPLVKEQPVIEAKPVETTIEPAPQPAASKDSEPATEPAAVEEEIVAPPAPATVPAATAGNDRPDLGDEQPVAPDALPKTDVKTPTTQPVDLPETGLELVK